jgi:hypothetical protein
MTFIRSTAEYTLLNRRRNNILEELKVDTVEKKLAQYKQNDFAMSSGWKPLDIQKMSLEYQLIGKRRPGRPLETNRRIES